MEQKLRILVVDDEMSIRRMLVQFLKEHAVVAVDSGVAALALLKTDPHFDLILLDYLMVGMDGMETLRALKSEPATCTIPVFITSGLADAGEIKNALLAAGAAAFISKPFDLAELDFQIDKQFPLD